MNSTVDIICHPIKPDYHKFIEVAKSLKSHCRLMELFDFSYSLNDSLQIFYEGKIYQPPQIVYFYSGVDIEPMRTPILFYLKQQGVKVVDLCLSQDPYWYASKTMEAFECITNEIPIIPTQVFVSNAVQDYTKLPEFPLIVKLPHLNKGSGVFFCQNVSDLTAMVNKHPNQLLLIQQFIQNEGDFRVLVVGDKCLGAIKRVRSNLQSEYLNNTSQGGSTNQVMITPEMRSLAIKSAKILKINIAGVDLIEINNQLCVMEVNRSPQFTGFMNATGVDVYDEIVRYLIQKT